MGLIVPDLFAPDKGGGRLLKWGAPAAFATAISTAITFPATTAPSSSAIVNFTAIPPRSAADRAVDGRSALHCTPDRRRCGQLHRDAAGWTLMVFDRPPDTGTKAVARYLLAADRNTALDIWPKLVVVGGSAREIYGVETVHNTGFSGGGATETTLNLAIFYGERVDMAEIASVPGDFSAMIRACFSERDRKRRRGACHDEYELTITLTLEPPVQSGMPRFDYTTRARTFPGRISRSGDSSSVPPSGSKDPAWAVDPACSYRRILDFDPKRGRYVFDAALPACEDYRALQPPNHDGLEPKDARRAGGA